MILYVFRGYTLLWYRVGDSPGRRVPAELLPRPESRLKLNKNSEMYRMVIIVFARL